MLRDLWRWQHPVDADPIVERVMRGDETVIDVIDAPSSHHLLRKAADYGRWQLVTALVGAGVPVEADEPSGTTPLHVAAGAGESEVVELLVEHGADLSATDPEFHATPATWARFLGHEHIGAWLDGQTGT